jgi:NADH-quinone oxidoreductase subunit J
VYLIVLSLFILFLDFNPVFSVIYFINIVLNLSFILFLNNLEFFGILLIIVYIGAILVSFLFVIMMLQIQKVEEKKHFFYYLIFIALSSLIFIIFNLHLVVNFFKIQMQLFYSLNI